MYILDMYILDIYIYISVNIYVFICIHICIYIKRECARRVPPGGHTTRWPNG